MIITSITSIGGVIRSERRVVRMERNEVNPSIEEIGVRACHGHRARYSYRLLISYLEQSIKIAIVLLLLWPLGKLPAADIYIHKYEV